MTDVDATQAASHLMMGSGQTEEVIMNSGKNHQSIGCEVTSCRFNKQGCDCELEHIEVRPSCDCHSGDCNEANCGSYTAK